MHPTKLISEFDKIIKRAQESPSPQSYKVPSKYLESDQSVKFTKFPRISYFEEVMKLKSKIPGPEKYDNVKKETKRAATLNTDKPASFVEHQQWEIQNNSSIGDYNPDFVRSL